MDPEVPVHRRCGGELVKRSYKKDGQRMIWAGILLFPLLFFIAWGTLAPEIILVIFIYISVKLKRKKPEEYYTCRKCHLKIEAEDLDSKMVLK
jgi:hypothetical protein